MQNSRKLQGANFCYADNGQTTYITLLKDIAKQALSENDYDDCALICDEKECVKSIEETLHSKDIIIDSINYDLYKYVFFGNRNDVTERIALFKSATEN